jgi:dolichol-phosphate mannosyltransferase
MSEIPNPAKPAPLLSVVVPVLNEGKTLRNILDRIALERTAKQIVVVDDGSTDDSRAIAEQFAREQPDVLVLSHPHPRGKGTALQTGFAACEGEYVVVQDGDLEYDPAEITQLLEKARSAPATVVYGSREEWWRTMGRLQRFANWCLTFACNLLYRSKLADIMTCYKLVSRELLQQVPLESAQFEIECEMTAKFILHGWRIVEVPIRYSPRTREEGKKIRWTDGVRGLWTLLKYRLGYRPR